MSHRVKVSGRVKLVYGIGIGSVTLFHFLIWCRLLGEMNPPSHRLTLLGVSWLLFGAGFIFNRSSFRYLKKLGLTSHSSFQYYLKQGVSASSFFEWIQVSKKDLVYHLVSLLLLMVTYGLFFQMAELDASFLGLKVQLFASLLLPFWGIAICYRRKRHIFVHIVTDYAFEMHEQAKQQQKAEPKI